MRSSAAESAVRAVWSEDAERPWWCVEYCLSCAAPAARGPSGLSGDVAKIRLRMQKEAA